MNILGKNGMDPFQSLTLQTVFKLSLYFSICNSTPVGNLEPEFETTRSDLDIHYGTLDGTLDGLLLMTDEQLFGSNHLPPCEDHIGSSTANLDDALFYDNHVENQLNKIDIKNLSGKRKAAENVYGEQLMIPGSLEMNEHKFYGKHNEINTHEMLLGSSPFSWEEWNDQVDYNLPIERLQEAGDTGSSPVPTTLESLNGFASNLETFLEGPSNSNTQFVSAQPRIDSVWGQHHPIDPPDYSEQLTPDQIFKARRLHYEPGLLTNHIQKEYFDQAVKSSNQGPDERYNPVLKLKDKQFGSIPELAHSQKSYEPIQENELHAQDQENPSNSLSEPLEETIESGTSVQTHLGEFETDENYLNTQIGRIEPDDLQLLSEIFSSQVTMGVIEDLNFPALFSILVEGYDSLSLTRYLHIHYKKKQIGNLNAFFQDQHIRIVQESTKKLIKRQFFLRRLKSLTRVIVFSNTAILRRFFQNKIPEAEVNSSNKKLIELFRNEFFCPEFGLPALGKIPNQQCGMNITSFRELQIYLIKYFSATSITKETMFKTALCITMELNHKGNPQVFNFLKGSGEMIERSLLVEAFYLELNNKKCNKNIEISSSQDQLLCFSAVDFKKIPSGIMPAFHFDGIQSLGKNVAEICVEIESIHSSYNLKHYQVQIIKCFEDMPLLVIKSKNSKPHSTFIKVTNKHHVPIRKVEFMRRVKSLLTYSLWCNCLLVTHISENAGKFIGTLEESKKSYIDWIRVQFIGSETILPIFGIVNQEIQEKLNILKYGESQIGIINFLSTEGISMLLQLSIGLNRSWFQETHPDLWNKIFLNRMSFSIVMIDLINRNPNLFKGFERKTRIQIRKKNNIVNS